MTMTSTLPVVLERDGAVAYLTFNRPERLNALDIPTAQAFLQACHGLADDASVRAVVLRGVGRDWRMGGVLETFGEDCVPCAPALIAPMHEGMHALATLGAPVIAALNGHVAGPGVSIVLGVDLAIAASGTRLSVAYGQIGASWELGMSNSLPRLVGVRRALEIALLGGTVDADQAHQWGLVNRVVPASMLDETVQQLANGLAAGPTFARGESQGQRLDSLASALPSLEQHSLPANTSVVEPLSPKELRVLLLVAEGYSNTAMAEKLFVSNSTVCTHLRNINSKLDCHNRTQAVAVARRLGLIR